MKNLTALIALLFVVNNFAQEQTYSGTIFNDINGNGIQERNEKGIPNVVVSDQITTVVSNNKGNYTLKSTSEFPYLFISQPNGFVGTYFYPKKTTTNFPLKKGTSQRMFSFIHASDTHMDSLNLPRMKRFRQMTDSLNVDFIIVTGDLIRDALRVDPKTANDYYKMYVSEISKFSMPVYSGVGNHEIFGIERDKSLVSSKHPLYGKNMYRSYLGPNYYSFNYGGIHFISIDGVGYQNLYYFGGVDKKQLEWLSADVKHVSKSSPIVTFNHIPFVSPGFSFQNFEHHIFYGPQLLLQNNKLQHRHIVYNFKEVKKRLGTRPYPLALAGHYHAAQEGYLTGSETVFSQTSAITRPDTFVFNGFKVRSGFTLYKVKDAKIVSSTFIPLNLPD